jgi:hypothetical protein
LPRKPNQEQPAVAIMTARGMLRALIRDERSELPVQLESSSFAFLRVLAVVVMGLLQFLKASGGLRLEKIQRTPARLMFFPDD